MSQSVKRKSVLFVCLGNICRSPTGEGVLLHLVNKRRLSDRIVIDSAGTGGWNVGVRADRRMRRHSEFRGYELQSRARVLRRRDLVNFDLVIAMDQENLRDIQRLHAKPKAEVKLLSDFLDADWPRDVPDPYGSHEQEYERVLDMVEAACPQIIEYLVGPTSPR